MQRLVQEFQLFFSDQFLAVSTPKKTWSKASEHCQSLNGELATFTSIAEQNKAMDGHGTGYYFIGLSDEHQEGQWVWADGSTSTWMNWASNEPNGGTGEGCVVLYYDGRGIGRDGYWFDVTCGSARMFVCKISSKNFYIMYSS